MFLTMSVGSKSCRPPESSPPPKADGEEVAEGSENGKRTRTRINSFSSNFTERRETASRANEVKGILRFSGRFKRKIERQTVSPEISRLLSVCAKPL